MKKLLTIAVVAVAWCGVAAPERAHSFKIPSALEMLRPGEVHPQGWLRDRCVAARDGYVSRLDDVDKAFPRAWNRDFHPRGKYLDWTDANKGAWCAEGGAYWFEGLVRLAWALDDEGLKARARDRLAPLLERMHPNALGFVYWMDRRDPAQLDELERANHGFIIGASGRTSRALIAYYEATGDERALQALKWCLDDPRLYFFGNPVTLPAAGCDVWRYCGDGALAAALENFKAKYPGMSAAKWPALRYGRAVEPKTIHLQARNDRDKNADWEWRLQHGVLAYESMYSFLKLAQWSGDRKLLGDVVGWSDWLERNTLQVHGVTVADEQYGGPGEDRGTETCTVAGDLLLNATLAGLTGEGRYGDHVERAFFNAGAACASRDWMHHVYFQAPNRTAAIGKFVAGPTGKGGIYQRKHWPLCCTAALTRILPGYVQWMWMRPAEGGLAAVLYGPNTVETTVAGTAVRIDSATDYPFDETIALTVRPAKDVAFPLQLRVPAWCERPEVAVNGEAVTAAPAKGFVKVSRTWRAGDKVTLRFPMRPTVTTAVDGNKGKDYKPTCSVSMGPLLFAYAIPSKDENTPKEGARTDWTLDSTTALADAKVTRRPMPKVWDWPEDAPLKVTVKTADGSDLALVPYGCARLRISMFPDEALPDWRGDGMAAWARGAHQIGKVKRVGGEVTGEANGRDPFWVVCARPFTPTAGQEIVFRGKSAVSGLGEIYWAKVGEQPTPQTRAAFRWIGDGKWHTYHVRPRWQGKGNLNLVRIDYPSDSVGRGELGIADVRICGEELSLPAELLTVGARFATPACRAGTEGRVEVVLRNIGTEPLESVRLRAVNPPKGLVCRDSATGLIAGEQCEMLALTVRSEAAFEGTLKVAVETKGAAKAWETKMVFDVPVKILPSLGLAKCGYVPEPKPLKSAYDIAALYFPGWERNDAWKRVWKTCPERRPYLGWYDETNPEVVDWQIKWLVENGIGTLYVDWYWDRGYRHHEHWVKAFQRAKWRKYLKWAMMWANHNPAGSHSEADQRAVTKYWIENCFNTPEYLTLDGEPVVWIWDAKAMIRDLGADGCNRLLEISRRMVIEAGGKGIHFIAMKWPEEVTSPEVMREYWVRGFDEVGIYHFLSHGGKAAQNARYPFSLVADANPANWWGQHEAKVMPFLPNLSTGWDDRPWNNHREVYGKNVADFRRICVEAKKFADATGVRRLCLSPLNEWGEGSYAEPNAEHGFGFYEAVRETFCEKPAEGWPVNMIPADVGLGPYDLPQPPQPRRVTAWDFVHGNRQGWQTFMGCTPSRCTDEGLVFETVTRDPAMHTSFLRLRARDYAKVTVRMKAEGAAGRAALFWARDLDGMNGETVLTLPVVSDGKFHDYTFDVSGHRNWTGYIGAIRFDPCENAGAKIVVASARIVERR